MPHMHSLHSRIELSKEAFNKNVAAFKNIAGSGDLGIVIKGNAYGHGLDEMLVLTQDNPHITWYFTASLSEALYLRAQRIDKPILVMSIIDQDPLLAFQQDIRLIFCSAEQFADLERAAALNLKAKIHLKVDTGLSRFGFEPDACPAIVKRLKTLPHVEIEGIYTHFAQAETEDQNYTNLQMQKFSTLAHDLQKITPIPYIHSHATSATIFRGQEGTNLFRVGAGLYGLWPSTALKSWAETDKNIRLKQVLTWKTVIIQTRTVAAGTPIGYGCSYIAPRSMNIAFLPVGYADGYHRRLSNCGQVLINNQLAPVIGRIGMNCVTIDITDVPSARIGTEVILTGPYRGITALDLAHAIEGFNPREITTPILCGTRNIVQ